MVYLTSSCILEALLPALFLRRLSPKFRNSKTVFNNFKILYMYVIPFQSLSQILPFPQIPKSCTGRPILPIMCIIYLQEDVQV